jgi:phenylpyruvate tautomerase PptA (4-oxalocrotonate tautomerase family)
MPVAKIHVLEGRYDEARLGKMSKAVQDALMSVLGVPPDDFFQIIHILPRIQFRHTPSFLDLKYSDDLILLEITFISGRPKQQRLALLKAVNESVIAAIGISPDDLMITFYEVPGENISFGHGLAQRAHISNEAAHADDRIQ